MTSSYPFVCKICGRASDETTLVCLDDCTDFFVCDIGFGCRSLDIKYHSAPFIKIYEDLLRDGKYSSPRGQKILEIENYSFILPPYARFTNFEVRKLNLNYIKEEFLWYLRGDKYDTTICKYASTWSAIINSDGTINSNYGQYIFGALDQFDDVIQTLTDDKDSRRAVIIILSTNHLKMLTNDLPCTYSMSFRIRQNRLNMTVRMRSQDSVWGMTNDVAAFSFIHEMVYVSLKEKYPELQYGDYFHSSDSFHVYEKHFEMLKQLPTSNYTIVDCPKINSTEEVTLLRNWMNIINIRERPLDIIPEEYKFAQWLFVR